MKKYYTRPCNFYYGNYAKKLIKKKKAFPVAGNLNIAFDQVEIFQRKKKGIVSSKIYPITKIKYLGNELPTIRKDLFKITSKRKSICGLKFEKPQIIKGYELVLHKYCNQAFKNLSNDLISNLNSTENITILKDSLSKIEESQENIKKIVIEYYEKYCSPLEYAYLPSGSHIEDIE